MKNQILLVLAVVFVACSQSGTPSAVSQQLDAAVKAGVASSSGQPLCGDDAIWTTRDSAARSRRAF